MIHCCLQRVFFLANIAQKNDFIWPCVAKSPRGPSRCLTKALLSLVLSHQFAAKNGQKLVFATQDLDQDQLRTLRLRQIPVSCCGAGESTQLAEAFEAARGGGSTKWWTQHAVARFFGHG